MLFRDQVVATGVTSKGRRIGAIVRGEESYMGLRAQELVVGIIADGAVRYFCGGRGNYRWH